MCIKEIYTYSEDRFFVGIEKIDLPDWKLFCNLDTHGIEDGYFWVNKRIIIHEESDTQYLQLIKKYNDYWKKKSRNNMSCMQDTMPGLTSIEKTLLYCCEKKEIVNVAVEDNDEMYYGYIKNVYPLVIECVDNYSGMRDAEFELPIERLVWVEFGTINNKLLDMVVSDFNTNTKGTNSICPQIHREQSVEK